MKFVDRAVAVRLEAAEDLGQNYFAEALGNAQPKLGTLMEELAGGHITFAGVGSPVGRAIGCGLTEPLTPAHLEHIEEFYFSRGTDARIDVTPLADDELFPMLYERGYRLEELNNVLARELAPGERFNDTAADGITIRAAEKTEAGVCARVLAESFSAPDFAPLIEPMFRAAHIALVAEAEGPEGKKIVATGNASISRRHRMTALHGAGTLPAYRGRGIQTALLGRRLNQAIKAECTLAVIVTRGATTSMRNAERLGFTLAYTKAVVKKPAPKSEAPSSGE
jgi:GNAT superfamily N-acetyltransferase